jgi:hypothetical protein
MHPELECVGLVVREEAVDDAVVARELDALALSHDEEGRQQGALPGLKDACATKMASSGRTLERLEVHDHRHARGDAALHGETCVHLAFRNDRKEAAQRSAAASKTDEHENHRPQKPEGCRSLRGRASQGGILRLGAPSRVSPASPYASAGDGTPLRTDADLPACCRFVAGFLFGARLTRDVAPVRHSPLPIR